MASIDSFIQAQMVSHRRVPSDANPDLARCLHVQKVAAVSVAAAAGIERGDLVVLIGGRPAGQVGETYWAGDEPQRRYTFHKPGRGERVDLTATGIELGMTVRSTAKSIAANYRGNPSDLEILWEEEDWKTLVELASRTILPRGEEDGEDDPRDHPALVFLGAGLYEIGATSEGMQLVEEYARQFASHWTLNFAALVRYYQARELESRGQRDQAVSMLAEAWQMHEAEKFSDFAEKIAGSRFSPAIAWLNRPFPIDYTLQAFDGSAGQVSLGKTLGKMPDDKLFMLCLLGDYRANGPYNGFMQRFVHCARWFGDFVEGLHVITMDTVRNPDRPYWFEHEDKARKARAPFEILYDNYDAVTEAVAPAGSPFILMLDKRGVVRYEGWFELVELWETIGKR